MPAQSGRRTSIAEFMMLTGGIGSSLGCWLYFFRSIKPRFADEWPPWIAYQAMGATYLLLPLSLTLLACSMKRSRRRMSSHPAAALGLTAFFVGAVNGLLVVMRLPYANLAQPYEIEVLVQGYSAWVAQQTAMAASTNAFIQAVSGRLRRPRAWLDVSVWALGVCWVVVALAPQFLFFL
ncbi:hypothetical protein [Paludisphaera mucosa]|uniref:Uncharacterized protein n=1 Tax=Paludisphaera mucosa TaxID=3030827 RepID=A0ABT6FFZ8_9BACT|nr:hypothetical protein [Paludisphaera mucosa]MDG3006310.1 hypothetical protein [Paludisphaera mucosa]